MSIAEVSVDELAVALDGGARLVDVREPSEYTEGHVPGAVLIPLGTVGERIAEFRGDGPLYVICRSGARSMRACEFLEPFGRSGVNVAGGTSAWIRSGRDVVVGDEPG